jgi:hypothetical protein
MLDTRRVYQQSRVDRGWFFYRLSGLLLLFLIVLFYFHIDHCGREITYDLRGVHNARKEGRDHLVWEDLDGNTIKVNLRRLDEK